MQGTLYQQMLPVECEDYTPALGVVIIIDRSGSMGLDVAEGASALDMAKIGAAACVNALNDRDYCAILTLDSSSTMELTLTSAVRKTLIVSTILGIESGGGTIYTTAIERAARTLQSSSTVEKKHIILVSDGEPNDTPVDYEFIVEYYCQNADITLSYVLVNGSNSGTQIGERMAALGGGRFYDIRDIMLIPNIMREDLNVDEIKESITTTFNPTINEYTSAVNGVYNSEIPTFYGTRAKINATVVLAGLYAPIYAQWEFGNGKVGSFMCDLSGIWSNEFLTSETERESGETINIGLKFIKNVINGLYPKQSVEITDIDAVILEDNFTRHLYILTEDIDYGSIEVTIVNPSKKQAAPATAKKSGEYYRYSFTVVAS